jgi:hypothetical protein
VRPTDAIGYLLAAATLAGADAFAPPSATPTPAASPSAPHRRVVAPGGWGGAHARLLVTAEETRVELECAHGLIPGPLEVDKKTGRLDSSGSLIRLGGGPGAETDAGSGEPARFSGKLTGKTLTLTVTLVGPAQDVGTFRLTEGRPGRLGKCP